MANLHFPGLHPDAARWLVSERAIKAVGLDTAWSITDYWAHRLGDEQLRANAAFLKQYVDRGQLGVKSGQGFYTYPDPAYARPGFIETAGS